jgi:hypothetical protein
MNSSAAPSSRASMSVAPSPTMMTDDSPRVALMWRIAAGFPPELLVNSASSNPAYDPSSLNRIELANTLAIGMPSDSASGWMIWRKPPDTRKTSFPCARSVATSSGMPCSAWQLFCQLRVVG